MADTSTIWRAHASASASPPENYERYFVPTIARPLAVDLVEAAALRPGERVLDVAEAGAAAISESSPITRPGTSTKKPQMNRKQSAARRRPCVDTAREAVCGSAGCNPGQTFIAHLLAATRIA